MSTKAGGSDHLFLFTYANHFLLDMVFVLIFSIYLFIYLFIQSDVNKSRCVVVLLFCLQIHARLDYLSHSNTMAVLLFPYANCCETGFLF